MYYNNQDHHEVSYFLVHQVHNSIQKRYSYKKFGFAAKDVGRAIKIEKFFQLIKNYNNNDSLETEDLMALNALIQNIPQLKVLENVFKNKSYDGVSATKKGEIFEEDVEKIVEAVFKTNTPSRIGDKKIISGRMENNFLNGMMNGGRIEENELNEMIFKYVSNFRTQLESIYRKAGNTKDKAKNIRKTINYLVLSKMGEKSDSFPLLKDISQDLFNEIKEVEYYIGTPSLYTLSTMSFKKERGKYVFAEVDGKIDVHAPGDAQLNFDITENVKLAFNNKTIKEGINALKGARMSLKAYQAGASVEIGNTNPVRAYFSTLSSLGFKYRTITSSYLHSINLMISSNKNDKSKYEEQYEKYGEKPKSRIDRWEDAKQQIYLIRFVYELTGAGEIYKDKDLKNLSQADFIVLNETNSKNIKVRSTSQILKNMFNLFDGKEEGMKNMSQIRRSNPFEGGMYILSSAFYR